MRLVGPQRRAVPLDDRVRVPRDPRIVENGALDGGEPYRQEAEYEAAGQGEAQLGVRHRDARPAELVELRTRARGLPLDALVVDDRAGRVAADQIGVAQEQGELVAIAAEPPVHRGTDGDGERPREQVAPKIDHGPEELPVAEARRSLEPPPGARERADESEQRVVVDQAHLGTEVG